MSKATANGFTVEFFTTSLTPEQMAEVDRQLTPDAIAELLLAVTKLDDESNDAHDELCDPQDNERCYNHR